jgi:hypothetical protein
MGRLAIPRAYRTHVQLSRKRVFTVFKKGVILGSPWIVDPGVVACREYRHKVNPLIKGPD